MSSVIKSKSRPIMIPAYLNTFPRIIVKQQRPSDRNAKCKMQKMQKKLQKIADNKKTLLNVALN